MGAGTDPGSDSGVAGGRDHRVVREGKVSPPLNPGRRPRLPEWVRQAAEADAELWDDPGEAATSPQRRGAVREPGDQRQLLLPVDADYSCRSWGETIWYRRYRIGHRSAGSATEAEADGRQESTRGGSSIWYERADGADVAGCRRRRRASGGGEPDRTRSPGCGPRRSSPFCGATLRER